MKTKITEYSVILWKVVISSENLVFDLSIIYNYFFCEYQLLIS